MKKTLFAAAILCLALFALGALTGAPVFDAGEVEAAQTLDFRQGEDPAVAAMAATGTAQIFLIPAPAYLDNVAGRAVKNPAEMNYMANGGKAYPAVTANLGGAGTGSNKYI